MSRRLFQQMLTRDGRFVQSYATKSIEDTVEDNGSGSIVLGSGTVRKQAVEAALAV